MRVTTYIWCLNLALLAGPLMLAQTAGPSGYVTWDYRDRPLGEVLDEIAERYQIHFSYSRNFILLDQRVTGRANALPVSTALEQLFEDTDIVFARIGSQFVLKRDPSKQFSSNPPDKPGDIKIGSEQGEQSLANTDTLTSDSLALDSLLIEPTTIAKVEIDSVDKEMEMPDTLSRKEKRQLKREDKTAWAEITLMPGYEVRSMQTADERFLNINLLYGKHDSIRGVELGLLVNEITEYAEGIQAAGVFNRVDGQFAGLQWAGLINQVSGPVEGVQVAGVLNTSGNHYGLQVSGLGNISNGNASGQVAPVFNISAERAGLQITSLFNLADEVTHGQISSFVNVAGHVDGFQLGLINIADSISGPSIGLLNFIRKGYNHVELFTAEALYTNLSIKLGSHRFYNIIEAGTNLGVQPWTDEPRTWGIGYGIGFHKKIGKKKLWGLNNELLAMKINEGTGWQRDLNLLTRARVLFSNERKGEYGFFFGPTFNLMISDQYDIEGNPLFSGLPPYDLLKEGGVRVNLQGWIGIQAGWRF